MSSEIFYKSPKKTIQQKVDQKGNVTAVAKGEANIYCRGTNGKRYTCTVNVYKNTGNNGATPEKIAEKIPYEINKVYQDGTRFFMYSATDDAWGEVPDMKEVINQIYPAHSGFSMRGVPYLQSCDGTAVNARYAGYMIYYYEALVNPIEIDTEKFYYVDMSKGDHIANYFSEKERKKVVYIGTTAFPQLYKYLGVYDLSGDGWLSVGEIGRIGSLSIDGAISDLTGIEYLTNLNYLYMGSFTGTNVTLAEANKSLQTLIVGMNTESLTVDAPYVKAFETQTRYERVGSVMEYGGKAGYVDVSACTGAEKIYLQAEGMNAVKLPENTKNLKTLVIWSTKLKSVDLSKLTSLEELSMNYNHELTKLDLTKNTNLTKASIRINRYLEESDIKLPEGVEFMYLPYNQ